MIFIYLTDNCKDTHKYCKSWTKAGFCKKSPDSMLKHCPASCGACNCQDDPVYSKHCPAWADYGYCNENNQHPQHIVKFMMTNCRKSCGKCPPGNRNNFF